MAEKIHAATEVPMPRNHEEAAMMLDVKELELRLLKQEGKLEHKDREAAIYSLSRLVDAQLLTREEVLSKIADKTSHDDIARLLDHLLAYQDQNSKKDLLLPETIDD